MRSAFLGILTALCFSFIFSCKNPFKTRKPLGDGTHIGRWEFPLTPELSLQNLLWAYNDKIISNYTSCLADSYRFVPSSADSALYPEIFTNWGLDKEISSTRGIFALDTILLVLTPDPSRHDLISQNRAVMYRKYVLIAVPSFTAPSSSPALGTAIFYLSRDESGKWLIYLQQDEPEQKSWALLKKEFLL